MQGIYIYLPQNTMSLGNTVLQLFYSYSLWCVYRYFQNLVYRTSTRVLSEVCVPCPVCLFSVVHWFRAVRDQLVYVQWLQYSC